MLASAARREAEVVESSAESGPPAEVGVGSGDEVRDAPGAAIPPSGEHRDADLAAAAVRNVRTGGPDSAGDPPGDGPPDGASPDGGTGAEADGAELDGRRRHGELGADVDGRRRRRRRAARRRHRHAGAAALGPVAAAAPAARRLVAMAMVVLWTATVLAGPYLVRVGIDQGIKEGERRQR